MKIGRITSLQPSPKRDVEVRISHEELFSAISEPAGVIKAGEVKGYDVVEELRDGSPIYRLFVRVSGGGRVLFYTAVAQFDVALLLDEFEAALRDVPRSWTKATP